MQNLTHACLSLASKGIVLRLTPDLVSFTGTARLRFTSYKWATLDPTHTLTPPQLDKIPRGKSLFKRLSKLSKLEHQRIRTAILGDPEM